MWYSGEETATVFKERNHKSKKSAGALGEGTTERVGKGGWVGVTHLHLEMALDKVPERILNQNNLPM